VREIDRRAIEEYGIPGVVLMENAGRNATEIILRACPTLRRAAIVCGRGNNGGDGFVIARHLHNAGRHVRLILTSPPESLSGDAAINYGIAAKMKLENQILDTNEEIAGSTVLFEDCDVIVDALLGTGFVGQMRPPMDSVIAAINRSGCKNIFAIDLPSGMDCDSGAPSAQTVRAHHTITFVALKLGFDRPGAAEFTGTVHVADIGAPIELIQQVAAQASG
jgi:NAD(P)H-hydrate epimerase